MDERRLVRISKYLARHLRHDPQRIGITLDAHGWVPVDELLRAAAEHGFPITAAELWEVVEGNDKRRYAIEGGRIRASQGHSVPVDLDLPEVEPPEVLYHGTVTRFVEAIKKEGLRPMSRHHVHLSPDRETAARVGARRGVPVVLVVAAGKMHADGHVFRRSANEVWLVDIVPPGYLLIPS
ncbi:RNA 2'-phosphotransferase [Nonomuraea polychroma]|uniref:RNA 2'-phosphotransferase n=1 Tax=Nonomuraea polychroma TaxID=46176 RepID=UPI003D8BB16D